MASGRRRDALHLARDHLTKTRNWGGGRRKTYRVTHRISRVDTDNYFDVYLLSPIVQSIMFNLSLFTQAKLCSCQPYKLNLGNLCACSYSPQSIIIPTPIWQRRLENLRLYFRSKNEHRGGIEHHCHFGFPSRRC